MTMVQRNARLAGHHDHRQGRGVIVGASLSGLMTALSLYVPDWLANGALSLVGDAVHPNERWRLQLVAARCRSPVGA